MAEPQYQETFRKALDRLMREIDNLRAEQAAIVAYQELQPPKNRFLTVAFVALQGDRLLRLIRIFEDSAESASFWYLHRCAPQRMKNLDIERLRDLSSKLKTVRNLTFVHLDKKGIFNAAAIWQEAGIRDSDVIHAMENCQARTERALDRRVRKAADLA